MNLKNMRRLVRHLRSKKNSVGFDMASWFRHNRQILITPTGVCRAVEKHPCGTAACLAGHAAILAWQSGDMPKTRRANIKDVATAWLGLDYNEAYELFHGNWLGQHQVLSDLTKDQAIAELNRLIEKG